MRQQSSCFASYTIEYYTLKDMAYAYDTILYASGYANRYVIQYMHE